MVLKPLQEIVTEVSENFWPFFSCALDKSFSICQISYPPLVSSVWILIGFIIYSFVWSIIGQNCSKVDQIWSITPWLYSLHFLYLFYVQHQGRFHERLGLLTFLMILWGVRLTYNFWKKGGYGNLLQHEEDYRWPILRAKMHPVAFFFFNFFFIAAYQNILLWLIALPAYVVSQFKSHRIDFLDIVLTFIFLLFLLMEGIADEQHFNFQFYKKSLTPEQRANHPSKSIRDGFLQSGLFRYSRHPNYFAEQAIWVVFYMFSAVACNHVFNFSIIGCILLIILFQGSIRFGESISRSKYPQYRVYQQSTPQLFPARKKSNRKFD